MSQYGYPGAPTQVHTEQVYSLFLSPHVVVIIYAQGLVLLYPIGTRHSLESIKILEGSDPCKHLCVFHHIQSSALCMAEILIFLLNENICLLPIPP